MGQAEGSTGHPPSFLSRLTHVVGPVLALLVLPCHWRLPPVHMVVWPLLTWISGMVCCLFHGKTKQKDQQRQQKPNQKTFLFKKTQLMGKPSESQASLAPYHSNFLQNQSWLDEIPRIGIWACTLVAGKIMRCFS